jgi:hypothetical protein
MGIDNRRERWDRNARIQLHEETLFGRVANGDIVTGPGVFSRLVLWIVEIIGIATTRKTLTLCHARALDLLLGQGCCTTERMWKGSVSAVS